MRPVYLAIISGDKPSRFIWAAVVSACSRIFDSLAWMGNFQIADPVRNEVIGWKEIVSWKRVSFLLVLITFLTSFNTLYFQALLCQHFFLFRKTLFLFISWISRHFFFSYWIDRHKQKSRVVFVWGFHRWFQIMFVYLQELSVLAADVIRFGEDTTDGLYDLRWKKRWWK